MIYNAIGIVSNLMGQPFEVNRQILYNMYLQDNHLLGQDVGVNPALFAQTLETRGVTESTEIDYGLSHIGDLPSAITYTDAATHTLQLDRMRTDAYTENSLSHVLAQKLLEGKPLLLYFTAMHDFMSQSGPLSGQPGVNFSPVAGGHAVAITSVDTANNMLTVASWGEQYGDHGYFHLSLDSFYPGMGGNGLNLWDVYEINGFNGVDLDFNDSTDAVAQAFVGLLDRAPAKGGMASFSYSLSHGGTLASVCDGILSSAEGIGLFGAASDTQYVQAVFNNVLGRDALAGGLSFYTSQLSSGTSRGTVAADIMAHGMDKAEWQNGLFFGDGSLYPSVNNPDKNIYAESLVFQNKVMAAQDYAITLQADGSHIELSRQIIDHVSMDPGSIWGVALVGVPEQLGHAHITPALVS